MGGVYNSVARAMQPSWLLAYGSVVQFCVNWSMVEYGGVRSSVVEGNAAPLKMHPSKSPRACSEEDAQKKKKSRNNESKSNKKITEIHFDRIIAQELSRIKTIYRRFTFKV